MTHGHEAEPIQGSDAPRPAAGLVTMDVDGELLLLDPRSDGVHQLDAVGSVIWQVLDGEATVDELAADLAEAYAAPVAEVRRDLGRLLADLRRVGALEGSPPPAAGHAADGPSEEDGLWRPSYLVDPPAP